MTPNIHFENREIEGERLYLTGLLLDGERKSVEPMAARLVEGEAQVEVMRQRLRQCVACDLMLLRSLQRFC